MAKFYSLQAKFIIRDGKLPCIYHRNQKWSLNITLSDPKEFDVKTGKLTSYYRGLDKDEINSTIQKRFQLINKLITEAKEKGVDSLDYIKAHLQNEKEKLNELAVTVGSSISETYLVFMLSKGYQKNKVSRTFEKYESQLARLKDFEKVNKKKLGQLDIKWVKDFAHYLASPKIKTYEINDPEAERFYKATKTLTQSNSTIQRFLKDIVSFLKFVMEGNKDVKFDLQKIRDYLNTLDVAYKDTENITVLSKKQWEDYKKYQPKDKFTWEVLTYDLFRFCINTGLRYSDVIRLNEDYVQNDVIKMKAQKTRGKFEVAMNGDALRIFNKYDRDFRSKFPANQRININLRKVLEQIDSFKTTVIDYKYVLNEVREEKKPFFKKLSFHDSRKTFVSFVIMNNQSGDVLQKVIKFTGWTDHRTLRHYLNVFGTDSTVRDLETLNAF